MNRIIEKIFNIIIPTFIVSLFGIVTCYYGLSLYLVIPLMLVSSALSVFIGDKLTNKIVKKHRIDNKIKMVDKEECNEEVRSINYVNTVKNIESKSKVRIKKKN